MDQTSKIWSESIYIDALCIQSGWALVRQSVYTDLYESSLICTVILSTDI